MRGGFGPIIKRSSISVVAGRSQIIPYEKWVIVIGF